MGSGTDVRVTLLEGLIDHAPLFPPASLSLQDALQEDRRARESASSWMLGRFVCPATRLHELPDVGRGVSVVLDAPLEPDARVEAVETQPFFDPGAGGRGGSGVDEVYVETPLDDGLDDRLDHLVEHGMLAKVRCGGGEIPDHAELARFVRGCRERALPFKATAGLHHAVRRDGEHGFLNLLAAAVFGDEERALEETDPAAFGLDEQAFVWRDRSAGMAEVAAIRRTLLRSIGSCSFFEPVEELEALGVLPL